MSTFLNFIVVLGILIFFHELGHFLVARLFGVGVEKFSLGFGPRLFGKKVGRTDYRVSLFPLGGYVKMVGEEPDSPLPPEDIPFAFNHKPVVPRSLIVAAGPLFNVLLAILIFTFGIYFAGLPSIRPVIRSIDKESPAYQAGLQTGDFIEAIDGVQVDSWRGIDEILDKSQGESLTLQIKRNGESLTFKIKPKQTGAKDVYGDDIIYYDLGIEGYTEPSAVVDKTIKGKPAEKAGMQEGDLITAIDGQPIERWETMQEIVSSSKGRPLLFKVLRGNETFEFEIKPEEVQEKNAMGVKESVYRIGIQRAGITIPEEDQITLDIGLLGALTKGGKQTWNVVKATGYFFVKLVERKVPTEAIGGPIRIALLADQQAEEGFLAWLYFIAIISVNLAVINLLPIPVLDGGHLLFFAIEAVQRKPVSLRMRETAQQVGMFLLLLLMIFVFYNDIVITWFR